ncbi:MAG: ATP-binding protein [Bacteroidia bacterium]|nr:ATP-binding protein [Bacteroidia bacterium]MDW8134326.1 ATP-binding protein [Bacteroidia bacterium]
MNHSYILQEQFSQDLTLHSHVDELLRVEPLLVRFAQQIGMAEDRLPLFVVAVTEALSNAIIHGNRQAPGKHVQLKLSYEPSAQGGKGKLYVKVQDEGEGFDPESLPDPTIESNLLRESGRGIFLMRNIADSVEFLDKGRCVILQFFL